MYLLKFLQQAGDRQGAVNVEYRVACSGEFYNRNVETFDWRKSDVTRVLLQEPALIFVTSLPFDSYPQELCVRVALNSVTEESGTPPNVRGTRIFLADEDVVENLCAVLCLLSRRLVSVVASSAAALCGYMGDEDEFDKAIAEFAMAYADQTERDWRALLDATKSGRISEEARPLQAEEFEI